MSSLMAAKELNVEYHIAGNWGYKNDSEREADERKYGIHIYQVDFMRSPINSKNIIAYKQLKEIVARENYDVIHCNTPIGGVLGRLVAKKYKTKHVIYQVHGFHFYKGAPKLNWLIYYPIEKWLARYTDTLITINQEDFDIAKRKFRLRKHGEIYLVPGVGIDLSQYESFKSYEVRSSLGIADDDIMLISAGDLVDRKNYKLSIRVIAEADMSNLKYCICGTGEQLEKLKEYAKELGVESQIKFLGFRSDVKVLLQVADIFLFTTKQEGLPRSMMEAMASGLPCVASKVRGNTDLLEDGVGGYLCDVDNPIEFAEAIKKLAENSELRKQFGNANLKHILEFDISKIEHKIGSIYEKESNSPRISGGVTAYNLFDYFPVRVQKRLELGLDIDDIVLISAGRLEANKNCETIIRAIAKVPKVKLLLCGEGDMKDNLKILAETLDVDNRVFFLDNRTDIEKLYQAADIFVMMSLREGLSRSIMEAMASGLPCIVSDIRGNRDLIINYQNGFLCVPKNPDILSSCINKVVTDRTLYYKMVSSNLNRVRNFEVKGVIKKLKEIYEEGIN